MHTALRPTVWKLPKIRWPAVAILLLMAIVLIHGADAGTTGTDFEDLYRNAKEWIGGYLGRSIAFFAFMLGAGWSAAKQTMMPVIFGLMLALVISFGPDLLDKLLSAVV